MARHEAPRGLRRGVNKSPEVLAQRSVEALLIPHSDGMLAAFSSVAGSVTAALGEESPLSNRMQQRMSELSHPAVRPDRHLAVVETPNGFRTAYYIKGQSEPGLLLPDMHIDRIQEGKDAVTRIQFRYDPDRGEHPLIDRGMKIPEKKFLYEEQHVLYAFRQPVPTYRDGYKSAEYANSLIKTRGKRRMQDGVIKIVNNNSTTRISVSETGLASVSIEERDAILPNLTRTVPDLGYFFYDDGYINAAAVSRVRRDPDATQEMSKLAMLAQQDQLQFLDSVQKRFFQERQFLARQAAYLTMKGDRQRTAQLIGNIRDVTLSETSSSIADAASLIGPFLRAYGIDGGMDDLRLAYPQTVAWYAQRVGQVYANAKKQPAAMMQLATHAFERSALSAALAGSPRTARVIAESTGFDLDTALPNMPFQQLRGKIKELDTEIERKFKAVSFVRPLDEANPEQVRPAEQHATEVLSQLSRDWASLYLERTLP